MRKSSIVSSWVLALVGCDRPTVNESAEVLERDDIPQGQSLQGEICETWGSANPCGPQQVGTQYCMVMEESAGELNEWGVCVVEPECEPGDLEPCGADGSSSCTLDIRGVPTWGECIAEQEPGDPTITPLVLQLPGETLGFEAAGAASFELGADCLAHDWPGPNTPWLALDRDGSGSIDGGHELFGSATVLPDGTRAQHGFEALAALDTDGDGAITAQDPAFARLVLWADHDRDRRSTHWEHTSLASAGIEALPVAYAVRSACDERGNCAHERAEVVAAGTAGHGGALVDVHLACQ